MVVVRWFVDDRIDNSNINDWILWSMELVIEYLDSVVADALWWWWW